MQWRQEEEEENQSEGWTRQSHLESTLSSHNYNHHIGVQHQARWTTELTSDTLVPCQHTLGFGTIFSQILKWDFSITTQK